MDELRVVARYAVESAEEVLTVFEQCHPGDRRPRAAIEAARAFAGGARRTNLQRTTALDAHRAAKAAATEAAKHAAHAAGDAAAAAYLHPLAQPTQVGHILRAAAHAARVAELRAGDDPAVGDRHIEQARVRATPTLVELLGRYPLAPTGGSRVAQLMTALDAALRNVSRETPTR
ncbi:exonuclease SbcC [Pseudonocardiaceae bacterium YIM PH 21723]|nr:exonuclease SbcC [Pseudonocardiaceae bacterium YIM PH 21723]